MATTIQRKNNLSWLTWLMLCLLSLPVVYVQWQRVSQMKLEGYTSSTDADAALSLTSALPTFGFNNLTADFLWLRFVQYFGDLPARRKSGYTLNYRYLKVITERDPHFEKAYRIVPLAIAYSMGRLDLAEELLRTGVQVNPNSYDVWQARGFLHFLYTGNTQEAVLSFRQSGGAAVAREGNARQRFANYWIHIARGIEAYGISTWTLRGIWKDVYANAADEPTRWVAVRQLRRLGVKVAQDGFYEEFPAPPPPGYARLFVYGPPSPLKSK